MDRVSRYGTFICFGLLLLWYFYQAEHQPPVRHPAPRVIVSPTQTSPAQGLARGTELQATAPALPPAPTTPEIVASLETPELRLTFSNAGGALKTVQLKNQKNGEDLVILNDQGRHSLLAVQGWADGLTFTQKASSPSSVTYSATLPNGLLWERTYTLTADYVVTLQDQLTNPGTKELLLPDYGLCLGRSEVIHVGAHHQQLADQYLGAAFYTTKMRQITVGDFDPASFLWLFHSHDGRTEVLSTEKETDTKIIWAAAQNQFYAQLLTPTDGRTIDQVAAFCYNPREADGSIPKDQDPDLETFAHFAPVKVAAGQTTTLSYTLYAGPKDYDRLGKLGETQATLMNYGYFVVLIYPMLWLLRWYHAFVGTSWGWGWAIIMLTATVKIITWPVQSAAYRAGKRMQAVGPMLKEIQVKYKDSPEKLHSETWSLYKDYGVNPLGGCWTAFIQMPVFFSLYFMLQNAVDLRGAPFLWAHDLSQTDTIFSIAYGTGQYFNLNPLPILVTATMMVMMRLTPMAGTDPMQARVAQFMPLFFLFIFYNFASALSLYYVVNNTISIFQVYRNLKKPLPVLTKQPKKKKP